MALTTWDKESLSANSKLILEHEMHPPIFKEKLLKH